MGDDARKQIRERVWVEKIDHSGDTPVLVETVFTETHKPFEPDETPTTPEAE